MDPNLKFLLIVRDPVKRLMSDYNQHKYRQMKDGNKNFPEFEEYIFLDGNKINTSQTVKSGKVFVLMNEIISAFLYM